MNPEPETKVRLRRRWSAWSMWILTACLGSLSVAFVFLNRFASFPDPFCCSGYPSILTQIMALACSTVGALIVSRKPGNSIGWIFTFSGLGISLNFFALNYAIYTGVTRPASLPFGSAMAWLAGWIWIPAWWPILAFLLLLFPSGRLLSRRWRPVAYLVVLVLAANTVVRMFMPGILDWSVPVFENPLGAGGALGDMLRWAEGWVFSLLLISILVSALSLTVRFTSARGTERQQIKWLAYAGSLAGLIVFSSSRLLYGNQALWTPWMETLLFLPILGIPVSVGIAILRHRLFDIDLLINRTLVYSTLTVGIAGFYVLAVGSLSGLLQNQNHLAAPAVALLMAAALIQPLRRGLQEIVNHFVPVPGVVIRDSTARPVPQIQQEQKPAVPDGAPVAATHGPWWLVPAHAAWWACAAFALLIFLAAIPLGYAQRFSGPFDVLIDAPGWYLVFMSVAQATISMLTALVCLTLAVLLFWNRRQEPMKLFVSFFLMAYGIVLAGPLEALNGFPLLSAVPPSYGGMVISTDVVYKMQTALFAVMPLLFYLFPSGRFVPGWTRYLALLALLLVPVVIRTFSTDWPSTVTPFAWSYAALVGIGIYAQIYRYRRVATPLERQQTKWVVFGVVLTFAMLTVLQIPYAAAVSIPAGVAHPWWQPLTGLGWYFSLMILPLSLAISVMGYRLWDIDLIISRTLVYGALTASVVALYVLIVGWLSIGLQTNTLPASVFAILIISILFQPLRRGLQGIADRLVPRQQPAMPSARHRPQAAIREEHAAADTILRGRRLLMARTAWVAVFLALTTVYAFGFLATHDALSTACKEEPCTLRQQVRRTSAGEQVLRYAGPPIGSASPLRPGQVEALGNLGLTLDQYGWLGALQMGLPALLYLLIGAVLYWRKSDNWMVLFVSITIALFPLQNMPLPFTLAVRQPAWEWPVAVGSWAALSCFLALPLFFPTGTFVPRWTRWVGLCEVITGVSISLLTNSSLGFPERFIVAYLLTAFGIGAYAQLHRYFRVANSMERQQIKWGIFGLVGFVSISILALIPLDNFLAARAASMDPARAIVLSTIPDSLFWVVSFFIPISITFSVARYRLWDIDLFISRTLVYGALTGIVVGAFVLMVGLLGRLFQSSGNSIIAILATGLVALLFNPLRQRLQRGVNRLLYGERDEPYAALSRLGRRLEATLAPGDVLPTVVTTVREVMKLPYAAIYREENPEGYKIVAESAAPGLLAENGRVRVPGMDREGLCLPLIHQGETLGYLVLGPRAPSEAFHSTDLRLLDDLAPQVGAALHAVRLTADLQRSRERLVSTREEERLRLRRDLHDGLGPQLAGLALRLETARNRLGENDEAAALLTDLSARTQEAVADIRRLVYGLRPPALDELGLVMALREGVARHNEQCINGTNMVFEAPESLPPLPAAVEVAAYRIAQEALNNVLLHAQANTCLLRLSMDERGGFLCLEIQDDGKGLPLKRHAGVGLNSMRERAEELGGSLAIASVPAGGTLLSARLPYRPVDGSGDASSPAEEG